MEELAASLRDAVDGQLEKNGTTGTEETESVFIFRFSPEFEGCGLFEKTQR
jgi:hypothetical protein